MKRIIRLTEGDLVKLIKRVINEDEGVSKFLDKYIEIFFPNNIVDYDIDGKNITIKIRGESRVGNPIIKKFKDQFNRMLGDNFKFEFEYESKYNAEVEYEKDGRNYYITLTKELGDGDLFELEGKLIPYHSGRAAEYEFEIISTSDEEYWDEHWEDLEQYVLDNIPYEKKKINEGEDEGENEGEELDKLFDISKSDLDLAEILIGNYGMTLEELYERKFEHLIGKRFNSCEVGCDEYKFEFEVTSIHYDFDFGNQPALMIITDINYKKNPSVIFKGIRYDLREALAIWSGGVELEVQDIMYNILVPYCDGIEFMISPIYY